MRWKGGELRKVGAKGQGEDRPGRSKSDKEASFRLRRLRAAREGRRHT